MDYTVRYLQKLTVHACPDPLTLEDAATALSLTSPTGLCQAIGVTDFDPAGVYDDVCRDLDTLMEDLGNNTTIENVLAQMKGS